MLLESLYRLSNIQAASAAVFDAVSRIIALLHDVKSSQASPYLIRPALLFSYLNEMPSHQKAKLPFPLELTHIGEFFDLISTKVTFVTNGSIAILLTVPLVDSEEPYSIYRAIPVPSQIDHAFYDNDISKPFFKEIVLDHTIIAMNIDVDRHITLRSLRECQHMQKFYLCRVAIIRSDKTPCLFASFRGATINEGICDFKILRDFAPVFIPSPSGVIFSVPRNMTLMLRCDGESMRNDVIEITIEVAELHYDRTCALTSDAIIVPPLKRTVLGPPINVTWTSLRPLIEPKLSGQFSFLRNASKVRRYASNFSDFGTLGDMVHRLRPVSISSLDSGPGSASNWYFYYAILVLLAPAIVIVLIKIVLACKRRRAARSASVQITVNSPSGQPDSAPSYISSDVQSAVNNEAIRTTYSPPATMDNASPPPAETADPSPEMTLSLHRFFVSILTAVVQQSWTDSYQLAMPSRPLVLPLKSLTSWRDPSSAAISTHRGWRMRDTSLAC